MGKPLRELHHSGVLLQQVRPRGDGDGDVDGDPGGPGDGGGDGDGVGDPGVPGDPGDCKHFHISCPRSLGNRPTAGEKWSKCQLNHKDKLNPPASSLLRRTL